MKIIELPDGTEAEFPDEMHDDAIGEVLRKQFAPPPPKQPDSFLSRVGQGAMDPIVGAGQLAEKIPGLVQARKFLTGSDTGMGDVIREREATYSAPEDYDAARFIGNVANPLSWAGGGAGVLRAAGQGALQAALTPVTEGNFAEEKAKQAALGGALGGVLSKAMKGFTPSKEAQALMDQGIQPSFGQSMAGTGRVGNAINQLEQKASSIPLVGDAVNWARDRPMKEFEGKVLEKITGKPMTLDEATAHASKLYEAVVPKLVPTQQATSNVMAAVNRAMQNPEMTPQSKDILAGLVNQQFASFPSLKGAQLKKLDSELGYIARKYQGGDPASKTLAGSIFGIQQALREGLETGLEAGDRETLQQANKIWKELIPVHKAASTRADERLMPRALQKALARQQKTDVTRMRPNELVDPAVAVLPSNVPDSGTAGRLMLGSAGAMGAGSLGVLPAYLGAGLAAGIGATRKGQAALVGNTKVQKALSPYDAGLAAAIIASLRAKPKDE